MKVAVVLPTYNRGYTLSEAIQSALEQTHSDFELIVVDDGSTDDTTTVLSRFHDSRIRVIRHPENAGYSQALNTGVSAAEGDLISFLDSDDLWKPDKLQCEIKFLAEHSDAGGVFCDMEGRAGNEHTRSRARQCRVFSRMLRDGTYPNGILLQQRELYLCLLQEQPFKLQGSAFRFDAFARVGAFRSSWPSGSDWEFMLRFTRQFAMGYIDRPLAVLRTMADSTLARYQRDDAANLMNRFLEEQALMGDDHEARRAIRRGLAYFANELGWQYMAEGERRSAFLAYLRGFCTSHHLPLLLRCTSTLLPGKAWQMLRRLKNGAKAL